jgi:hypothetical protein
VQETDLLATFRWRRRLNSVERQPDHDGGRLGARLRGGPGARVGECRAICRQYGDHKITEIPFSNATDRVLDPTWSATGTVFGGSSQINVLLRPGRPSPLPPGSLLAIDFTDSSGNFHQRPNVEVDPRWSRRTSWSARA